MKLGWDLAGYAVEKKNRRVSTTGLASLADFFPPPRSLLQGHQEISAGN